MGRNKKDKFEDLSDEFKDSVVGMDEVAIRKKIAEVALHQVAVFEAKENDRDLEEKKVAYQEAGAGYREVTKSNKLKIAFCRRVLGDKGKDVGSFDKE